MPLRDLNNNAHTKLKPEVEAFLTDIFSKMKTLINQEIKLHSLKLHFGANDEFFKEFKRRRFLLTHVTWEDKGGVIAVLNSVETAISMSGYMWTLPSNTIEVKVKARDLDEQLQDVYKEVSNQLYGSINQNITSFKDPSAQLQFLNEDMPISGKKNDLIPAGNYIIAVMELVVGEQAPSSSFLLITDKVAREIFDCEGISLTEEGVEEARGLIEGSLDKTPVERVMDTEYPGIDIEKTIGDAYDLMESKGLEVLPILEDETKLLRVITKNNIEIMKSVFFDAPGMEERRARIMCIPLNVVNKNQEVIYVKPTDMLSKAARLMVKHRIAAVPVVDGDRQFVGLVSSFQLLDLLAPPENPKPPTPQVQVETPAEATPAEPAKEEAQPG